MKRGDVVHKRYVVVEALPPGGKSENAKVTLDGREFFLKKFASPKYPYDASKFEAGKIDKLIALCAEFEGRHVEILRRLDKPVVGGGNLVKPSDFFRERGSYYKVYPFVRSEPSVVVAREDAKKRMLFVKTLMLCVRELHMHDIVHSDLKPDNVLVERKEAGPVAKLIDFDEAYLSGNPPRRPGGDIAYMSPELARRLEGDGDPAALTTRSDIFSLGLVVHHVANGGLPEVMSGSGESHGEIVGAGGTLRYVPPLGFPPDFCDLLVRTVRPNPNERPSVDDLLTSLGVPISGPKPPPKPPLPPPNLKVNMGRRTAAHSSSNPSPSGGHT